MPHDARITSAISKSAPLSEPAERWRNWVATTIRRGGGIDLEVQTPHFCMPERGALLAGAVDRLDLRIDVRCRPVHSAGRDLLAGSGSW